LRLVDETVLRLVDAGVGERSALAQLMGTEPDVAVPRSLARMIQAGFLAPKSKFEVTQQGRQALRHQSMVERRPHKNLKLRYDPWQDEFLWEIDEERFKSEGEFSLPMPPGLDAAGVALRHREVQALLDAKGLPGQEERKVRIKRHIVDLTAARVEVRWRQVTVEVWHREGDGEVETRVLYRGGEPRSMSAMVRRMQEEGRAMLPLERKPPPPSPAGKEVERAVQAVVPSGAILETDDHRKALADMLERATSEIILVSPWLTTDAVDDELVSWVERALKRSPKLLVHIGYGIGDAPKAAEGNAALRKAEDQRRAIRKLEHLGNRFQKRLRLVEIGTTHQKLLIRDRQEAIVTSFNWLSFRPRPDRQVRLETGARVVEPASVAELVQKLRDVLRLTA